MSRKKTQHDPMGHNRFVSQHKQVQHTKTILPIDNPKMLAEEHNDKN